MNERPTPDTDAEHAQFKMGGFALDFCRKLERERDKAREDATNYYAKIGELEHERDEAREAFVIATDQMVQAQCKTRKALRERDEAREALSDWENAAAHVEANHPDEVHCGCVPVLRKLLIDARKERDEAREVLREIAEASGFDNIGNWARNKARKEIDRYREKNDLLPISWDV